MSTPPLPAVRSLQDFQPRSGACPRMGPSKISPSIYKSASLLFVDTRHAVAWGFLLENLSRDGGNRAPVSKRRAQQPPRPPDRAPHSCGVTGQANLQGQAAGSLRSGKGLLFLRKHADSGRLSEPCVAVVARCYQTGISREKPSPGGREGPAPRAHLPWALSLHLSHCVVEGKK